MREFIAYHLNLGVDRFYFYHNYGSTGNDRNATAKATKHGIMLDCFGYDEEKMIKDFSSILEQFKDRIIYIPWQARRPSG